MKSKVDQIFINKYRCKKCKSFPQDLFNMFHASPFFDHKDYRSYYDRDFFTNVKNDYYLSLDPKSIKDTFEFRFNTSFKSFCVKHHKSYKRNKLLNSTYNNCISCDCGATIWVIISSDYKNLPEFFNRKFIDFK